MIESLVTTDQVINALERCRLRENEIVISGMDQGVEAPAGKEIATFRHQGKWIGIEMKKRHLYYHQSYHGLLDNYRRPQPSMALYFEQMT